MNGIRHSFDVFDTALTRTFARPADLFLQLGRKWDPASPARWMRRRIEAEREARRRSTREETTLEEIYGRLAPAMGWNGEQARRAAAAELELENDSLRPVPEIRERIARLHGQGQSVVFISDTYKPAAFLRDALERNGLWKEGDRLYASSEEGTTKRSGGLFRVALERERLRPGDLVHAGDDDWADRISPRKIGLNAEPFADTRLNRHEQAIATPAGMDPLFRSRLAAASRLARLSRFGFETPAARTLWDVGASVVGPLLAGYVAWCLAEAGKRGIRRLYFVSRDGQILRRLAQTLCRTWRLDVECRDLFGSRHAWHLPALAELDGPVPDWIFDSTLVRSVDSILRRVGLDAARASAPLAANGFEPATWHRNLDAEGCDRLKSLLAREPLRSAILAEAETRRRAAAGYLRQEGLLDATSWALVDMGWSGRMQRSLRALLRAIGEDRPLAGFYFALNGSCPAAAGDALHSYLDPAWFAAKGLRYVPALETLAAADHGSVVGYREETGGRFAPIFRDGPLESRNVPWARLQQDAAVAFAEEFGRLVSANDVRPEETRRIAALLMKRFLGSPTREESRAYRLFRAGEDQAGGRLYRLATRIAPRHYWAALLRGGDHLYRLRWPEACIAGSLDHPYARIALLHARQALGEWKKRISAGTP